ncbi:hypothetical protein [Streptomyces sp. NPDC012510]|uniref:hypothetical protein n=1 Tax=Streptomyces sp. NPDC012510 TaxID=3364838 RepID=UPI0036E53B26
MSAEPAGRDPPPLLDWRDASHWSHQQKPCRYCGGLTNLRDSKRKPSHKVCAEAALAQQAAEQADAYHNEGHLG